jgi:hypothetical protein
MEFQVPEAPITENQRATLIGVMNTCIANKQPEHQDTAEIYCILQGLLLLVQNPPEPPEEEE